MRIKLLVFIAESLTPQLPEALSARIDERELPEPTEAPMLRKLNFIDGFKSSMQRAGIEWPQ